MSRLNYEVVFFNHSSPTPAIFNGVAYSSPVYTSVCPVKKSFHVTKVPCRGICVTLTHFLYLCAAPSGREGGLEWFCFAAKINAHISLFMGPHSHPENVLLQKGLNICKFQRTTPKWHILFINTTFQPTLTIIKWNINK